MRRASKDAALRLVEYAGTAVKNKNFDLANYLYQVAVNLAFASDDRDEAESKWMLSRMTHGSGTLPGEYRSRAMGGGQLT